MDARSIRRGLVLVTALTAWLVAPGGHASATDDLLRTSCITEGIDHQFHGCATLVRNDADKLVARGYADDAGEPGEHYALDVRTTNIRLQTRLCGNAWQTVRRNPSQNGWWDREYARTKGETQLSSSTRLYRAKVTVSWRKRVDGSNRQTRVITTRHYGSC